MEMFILNIKKSKQLNDLNIEWFAFEIRSTYKLKVSSIILQMRYLKFLISFIAISQIVRYLL